MTATVQAVPDPARPDDETAMVLTAEVYSEFREGAVAIDAALAGLSETCTPAAGDLSPAAREYLLRVLKQRRHETDELRHGKVLGEPITSRCGPDLAELLRPENLDLDPKVMVWCHCWTAGMADSGLMCIDREEPLFGDGIDSVSRVRIRGRICVLDAGIAAIVDPLLQEG